VVPLIFQKTERANSPCTIAIVTLAISTRGSRLIKVMFLLKRRESYKQKGATEKLLVLGINSTKDISVLSFKIEGTWNL